MGPPGSKNQHQGGTDNHMPSNGRPQFFWGRGGKGSINYPPVSAFFRRSSGTAAHGFEGAGIAAGYQYPGAADLVLAVESAGSDPFFLIILCDFSYFFW